MKVLKQIHAFDGKPVTVENTVLTLRTVLVRAIGSNLPGDQEMPVERVMARYALAMRIQSEEDPKLSPEEQVELRARVAKVWSLEVAGAALKLLDGPA